MGGSANEVQFEGELFDKNLRWAMGYKRDSDTRLGGILKPDKIKLVPEDIIFRFGNKRRTEREDRCGVWWMTQATLELNAERASTVTALIEILRQNLALPPGFSPLDRVMGATVPRRLSGFAGNGSGIFRRELKATDTAAAPPLYAGGIELDGSARGRSLRYQLFIPGLADCPGALEYGGRRTASQWFYRIAAQRQWP